MFYSLKDSLESFFEKNKINLSAGNSSINTVWKKVVGAPIKNNAKVLKFSNNKLVIKAATPVWRNELMLLQSELISKLNKELVNEKIKEILFL